jgi:sugar-phosphatase
MAANRLAFAGLPIPPVLIAAGDVKSGKPHPEPYLRAAEQLGMAASKCVVIEDAPAGIQAARSAGMGVIAVAATHPPAALADADVVARRLSDIRVGLSQDANQGRFAVRVKAIHNTRIT